MLCFKGRYSRLVKVQSNLVEAHCYGIGRTGQIFEQSRSSEETDRNVDVSTAKVFVSTMQFKVPSAVAFEVQSVVGMPMASTAR